MTGARLADCACVKRAACFGASVDVSAMVRTEVAFVRVAMPKSPLMANEKSPPLDRS
jgi:hypothetical protein